MLTRVEALKQFFGVPEKPITNAELIDFRKVDKQGFDEIADLCIRALEGY